MDHPQSEWPAMMDTQIWPAERLNLAAEQLVAGELVAFPTETVYGLGADATNPLAVAKIFEAKQRPSFDPLIVHVADVESVQDVAAEFSPLAQKLADAFWPGPITLVLPKRNIIPDLVTSGLPGVGVRVPQHELARALIRSTNRPLAAPSANPFGGISPTTAQHVVDGLGGRIKAVLDGGPCSVGLESSVISLMNDEPKILRLGGLAREEIEAVVGPIEVAKPNAELDDAAQPAPGMLSRHYAPGTPLRIVQTVTAEAATVAARVGLLTWGDSDPAFEAQFTQVVQLCADANLRTCASRFFAGLRGLDAHGLDVIIARRFPEKGLGLALNDRLQRAASVDG